MYTITWHNSTHRQKSCGYLHKWKQQQKKPPPKDTTVGDTSTHDNNSWGYLYARTYQLGIPLYMDITTGLYSWMHELGIPEHVETTAGLPSHVDTTARDTFTHGPNS